MSLNRFHTSYRIDGLFGVSLALCSRVGGAVVNGPLDSALVFLDYDFDGVLDAMSRMQEPIPLVNINSPRHVIYTIWLRLQMIKRLIPLQGQHLRLTLKAPSGAGVISPTSTLMKEGDLTAAEVAEVLGLPDGVDPLSFNPFNVDENDATEVARALEVAKISKQITTAISSFASATEGAGADAADAFTGCNVCC